MQQQVLARRDEDVDAVPVLRIDARAGAEAQLARTCRMRKACQDDLLPY